jgi:hypothetical protein
MQTPDNTRRSLFLDRLGHILPNRVLTCHLSSLTSCIDFRSIEYGRVSLQLEPFYLLSMIGVMCVYLT